MIVNRHAIRRRIRILAGTLLISIAPPASTLAGEPVDPYAGSKLSLVNYRLTFDEPFDKLDVSARGKTSRWLAHTPWNGDFGDALFVDPSSDGPFKVEHGLLRIEMGRKNGRWRSGLLASSSDPSHGFLQSGGYFEVRAKFPEGPGVWPSFWLGSHSTPGQSSPEIDVVEYYGQFKDAYLATTHVWRDGKNIAGQALHVYVPAGSLVADFHTFGVSIDEKNVIFYLDRREVSRQPSAPEYMKPVFMLVNLAAGGGWPITGMSDPSYMYVDYIRAYKKYR